MGHAVGSAEWLDERRSYIGASEAAEALGLSPWGDPIALALRKWGEGDDVTSSFRMKLGTMIEPIIGKLYEEETGRKLHRVGGPVRMRDYPFIASNPDFRIVGQRGLVQAKLTLDQPWGEPDDGQGYGIPLHYRLQGFVELATTGSDFVDFAALDPRKGLGIYPLRYDEGAIDDVVLDLVDYWRTYIEPKVLPPATPRSGSAILKRYPQANELGKVASAEQEQTLQELLTAQAAHVAAEAEFERLKNEVKKYIGDEAFIEGLGHRFKWSRGKAKIVAWKEVAGVYRGLFDRIRAGAPLSVATAIEQIMSDAVGTTSLDDIEALYTSERDNPRFTISESK